MSHYQLSIFAIHGLEHSGTDMNSWQLALWVRVSSRRKTKALQGGKLCHWKQLVPGLMNLDISSYLSWLTFINVAFPYMQQTYFHLIMSLHLLSFPKHSKIVKKYLFEVLVLLKCWNRGNSFPSDKRTRCITAGKAMKCRMNRAQIRPF